jgi:hypothetical protein
MWRPERESAGPIVVKKRGNARGAKEPYHSERSKRKGEPLGRNKPYYGIVGMDRRATGDR